jgi:hypothetical protein
MEQTTQDTVLQGRKLLAALKCGSRKRALAVLSRANPDLACADARGDTALHEAVRRNDPEMIYAVIACARRKPPHEGGLQPLNAQQMTPLHLAASLGHVEAAEALLSAMSPNPKNTYGETPLPYAIRGNHEAMVQLLLGRWAHVKVPDSQDKRRETPLHWAVRGGNPAIVSLIRKVVDTLPDAREREATLNARNDRHYRLTDVDIRRRGGEDDDAYNRRREAVFGALGMWPERLKPPPGSRPGVALPEAMRPVRDWVQRTQRRPERIEPPGRLA